MVAIADDRAVQPRPWDGRRRAILTFVASLAAQLIGSAFNIWYNLTHIVPLLTDAQAEAFARAINIFNLSVYPPALGLWFFVLWSLGRTAREVDPRTDPERWSKAQRHAINLPWIAIAIAGPAWLLTIPSLLFALHNAPDPLDPQVNLHLPVSVLVSAMIALTHVFFVVEIVGQRLWFPIFFADDQPSSLDGTIAVTLQRRGVIWAVSAVLCPIVSLLLLILVPEPGEVTRAWFPLTVGALGIGFGFFSAWMLGRIIGEPVETLRRAAERVSRGDLGPAAEIGLLRADEFGPLIDQFNQMVEDMREKRRIEEIFGRHVDPNVARVLMEQDGVVQGRARDISVIFTDIRGFTTRCGSDPPGEVVAMLNLYYEVMVERVERHNGIVTDFAGDGIMAIFGAIEDDTPHADNAVAAGRAMLEALPDLNQLLADHGLKPIQIGAGINSGSAIVGAIGAPRRSCYTAVGDMVPIAARVESLTKEAGHWLLFTDRTYAAMKDPIEVIELEPRMVRGRDDPVRIFTVPGMAAS